MVVTITIEKSQDDYVESVVCNESALKENGMKEFEVGSDGKVLLTKQDGKIFATGALCPHYNLPLVTGALGKGKLRCAFHGACFNLATGDIEDFPGLDSLPTFQVQILKDGGVKVKAKKSELQQIGRVKGMCKLKNQSKNYVIVGGGASAATCVETLRQEGCDSRIIMICNESHNPYDRIKVTKLLDGDPIKFQLRNDDFYKENNIELKKGVAVTSVDPATKQIQLSNEETINYEKLFIATGSQPKKLKIPGFDFENVMTMKNIDDTMALAKLLGDKKDKRVVISGSSFIAMESAAMCVSQAQSVTVIMRSDLPFQLFGQAIGRRLAKLYKDKGVVLESNLTISKVEGCGGRVSEVVLSDGRKLPADIVIMGVGSSLNTEFLQGSKVKVNSDGAVPTNEFLETSQEDVYAGGDIAYAPVFICDNAQLTIGHWQLAQYHGHIAAKNMLGQKVPLRTVPFFFTFIFRTSIRYAGYCEHPDDIIIVGDLEELKFTAYFCEGATVKAVVSTDNTAAAFAEYLHAGNRLSKKEIETNPTDWMTEVPKGKI